MRVACVNNETHLEDKVPRLVRGNVYTVIDSKTLIEFITNSGRKAVNGEFYLLMENNCWYHSSLFVPLNENQIDETELIKERQSEMV